ncbi:alpha/beta hydrolase [Streptomyces alkaliterrae]|uniref:Alpha/beta fold hydrolase n=3 Tax=Streptomyces alkaliterrae TaxID=2213162 RepID=A0A7W3WWX4_9ACTN|nr:alpha/beta hydrolase [Streptomyces alkaliterrae]MBB1259695.1 alpha/beta fold hydrolase [Streptomyces alkaliterrae]
MAKAARGTVSAAVTALLTGTALAGLSACTAGGGESAGPLAEAARDLAASPVPTAAEPLPEKLTGQRLSWGECPEVGEGPLGGVLEPMPDGSEWECATMKAPLDYSSPDGRTIDIALVRAPTKAADDKRVGSLVFNFGGPGGSGVRTLPASGATYASLHTRYDLVSFDPRGVGRSSAVKCLDDEELDEYHQKARVPTNAEQVERLFADQQRYNKACEENSGEILPYLTTVYTARDMDLLRQVLGDDKLHYFGISYGTELGGVYAHLFPDRVGRAAFDAVVDPTLPPQESGLGQTKGFQRALENYLEDCDSTEEGCPLGDPAAAQQAIVDLLAKAERDPLPANDPGDRRLTGSLAATGITLALYSKDFWEVLTEGLQDAIDDGDGTLLLRMSDLLNGRSDDGSYDGSQAAQTAISCADTRTRYSPEEARAKAPEFEKASPVFGRYFAWGVAGCHGWPVEGAGDLPDVSAKGADPILVIGNTGDPATPYEGAARMAEALGEDVAVQLIYQGEGHGAYNSGDDCVQRHVDAYLLEGTVPKDGTRCRAS